MEGVILVNIHTTQTLLLPIYAFTCIVHAGILREKTIADRFLYILHDDTQNYPFCRLQLVVETFGHSIKTKFNKSPQSC